MNDAFEILGINRQADTRQIRLAYRREAKTVHPDGGGNTESFIRLHRAYQVATSARAATKMRSPLRNWPPEQDEPVFARPDHDEPGASFQSPSGRYVLAEIAYRFELSKPNRNVRSFIAAIDAELYPDAETLELSPDGLELISYLSRSKVDLAVIVSAMVREIDSARRRFSP